MEQPAVAQSVSPWVVYGVPFMSGIAGAVLGSVLSWLTAGRKLARERGVVRRLDWVENMHDALVELMGPLAGAYTALIAIPADLGAANQHLTTSLVAMEKAQSFRHRARLFASQRASAAIRQAFERLEDPAVNFELTLTTPTETLQALTTRLATILNILMVAREELVHDMRSQLGLERLEKRTTTVEANAARMGLAPPMDSH